MLYLSEDATRIPRKKEVRKKVKGMSKKAVQVLLSVPDLSTKAGRRDLALMIIIYSTAARIDEILSLKTVQLHLDAEKPNVTVIGKGSKIRTLYLLPKAVAHLKKYLKEFHGDNPHPEAYVFYSRNTGSHGKMSQTAVSKKLKKHARAAHEMCDEVPLDLHAHQLRHAKASHWLDDGMNIVQISFLLGHEQLQTTMVYIDITLEHGNEFSTVYAAETLEELGGVLGYEGDALQGFLEEIAHWNEMCADRKDADWGYDPQAMFPIDTPPFFGNYTVTVAGVPNGRLVQLSGVNTDGRLRVLNAAKSPIKGLYAIGNVCGNRYGVQYHTPTSGNSSGMALTNGYVAAEYVVENLRNR